jgi:hypothetical protein
VATIEVRENQIEYHGHTLRVLAVHIDHQLVSDSFALFDASSETVASHICAECYAAAGGELATCGHYDIAVRRREDTIYWFLADHEYVSPLMQDVPLNHVWSFPLENYERQLNANASGLPDFNLADIHLVLRRATIYRAELGLFTIPDVDDDPQGRLLLDVVARSIAADDLAICPPPDRYRTIRIGIETDGVPETVVEVGIVNQRCAMRFVAHPSFPLWLTCGEIQRNVASIAT